MISYNENIGEYRKKCTFSCLSPLTANALLRALQTNEVTVYDCDFSDGTLSFSVDDDNYDNVMEFLKKIGGGK